ncbi:putative membrane protein YkoI [Streptosporangium album]|uniref:Putative membrane protein YkoI n=1 Tax=Streptosporangium album TaxID=47479 RepID=A0A7W7RYN2_9ACTN|nr:PepSY domain-containing protein [Streptosporangium album]MBB4940675.1 putative membrane protein YkoI [Streptosporangium album]
MKQITRITIASIGTAALLAGGGGIALAAGQAAVSTTTTSATTTASTAAAAASATASGISSSRAVQIAKKRVPGARVTEVEREWEHGQRVWKVELWKSGRKYEIYVSARTGKVIKHEREQEHRHGHGSDD